MKTIVTIADVKAWLKLPAGEDTELDALLSSLILTACTQIGDATGRTLAVADQDDLPETPEPIKVAIKFMVATWFEHPVAEAEAAQSVEMVVGALISRYRVFTYPNSDDLNA